MATVMHAVPEPERPSPVRNQPRFLSISTGSIYTSIPVRSYLALLLSNNMSIAAISLLRLGTVGRMKQGLDTSRMDLWK